MSEYVIVLKPEQLLPSCTWRFGSGCALHKEVIACVHVYSMLCVLSLVTERIVWKPQVYVTDHANRPLAVQWIVRMSGLAGPHIYSLFKASRAIQLVLELPCASE